MGNTVPADQELKTTCKVSGKHRNYNCVRRTGAGILAFILSALMIFLTSFLYVSEKVSFVSHKLITSMHMQLKHVTYTYNLSFVLLCHAQCKILSTACRPHVCTSYACIVAKHMEKLPIHRRTFSTFFSN